MAANKGLLAGKTLFITGATRGIGKAIALKAAQDGANIAIAAKTTEPHPKLPGTIYSAAKEVEKAGGQCLPCMVDIRNEDQIQRAIDDTVKQFGGIDILVNNASAISLTGTEHTTMKKFDLMNGVNARGTFICSKLCLPHLKQAVNPHILTLSPPLTLKPKWFAPNVAYSLAKFGMSLCTLGMADELKSYGIAVNSLWPKTSITTAAMDMMAGENSAINCRTTDIVADAAYIILCKDSKSYTGQFVIDEDLLREEGVTNFDVYAVKPGEPLIPDFYVDIDPDDPTFLKTSIPEYAINQQQSTSQSSVHDMVPIIESVLTEELVKKVNGIFQFDIQGEDTGPWFLDLKSGHGSFGLSKPADTVNCTLSLASNDFVKLFHGEIKPAIAYMGGKLKIKGDLALSMKLEKVMTSVTGKLKQPQGSGTVTTGPGTAQPAAPGVTGAASTADSANVKTMVPLIQSIVSPDLVKTVNGIFQFNLKGDEPGQWFLDLKSGNGSFGSETPKNDINCTVTLDSNDFVKMFKGQLKPTTAFMAGKIKVKGDIALAMKLEKVMLTVQSKL